MIDDSELEDSGQVDVEMDNDEVFNISEGETESASEFKKRADEYSEEKAASSPR